MGLYTVLREGVSQRESGRPGEGRLVDRAVGEVIEVSDVAAERLVARGLLDPIFKDEEV